MPSRIEIPLAQTSDTEDCRTDVDVVIVGGGPTGLFSGLLLHRLGVSVCVLDAKQESLEFGRADALNARTQQYFEVVDLLDEFLPRGLKCNRWNANTHCSKADQLTASSTFCNGEFTSRQSHWWTGLEHALHKNFLMIGQPVIEERLSRELGDLVHYGEEVDTITEDTNIVVVTTKSGQTIHASYAFGADGARSTVRSSLGISFTGTKPEMVWAVLDTFIETDFPICPEIITFQLDGQSRVSWIPRERGLSRFYVLLDGDVTLERAQESIKRHLAPHRVEFKAMEWYSTFEVKERIASSFLSPYSRVILGGDAAHVHSVNGGQGLNTGIADAFAIAWRLQTALELGHSSRYSQKLLQSYDIERRCTAAGVIHVAHTLVRDTLNKAKEYVSTIERTAAYITGMGITYQGLSSPTVRESEHGIWKAGHRCPDVLLTNCDGEDKWLYTLVTYGKFHILSVGARLEDPTALPKATAIYNILPLVSCSETAGQASSSQFEKGDTFSAQWLEPGDRCIVVVRPDMYIAVVDTCFDRVGDWFEALEQ